MLADAFREHEKIEKKRREECVTKQRNAKEAAQRSRTENAEKCRKKEISDLTEERNKKDRNKIYDEELSDILVKQNHGKSDEEITERGEESSRILRSRNNRSNANENSRNEKISIEKMISVDFKNLHSYYKTEKDQIDRERGNDDILNGKIHNGIITNKEKDLNKDWAIAESPNGKYYLDFKSPYFTMNERIRILEVALEDIRERYFDAKDEYNKLNRKYSKMKKKRRERGTK